MKTLLVDPYVTRHSSTELARAIDVDEPTVRKAFPAADVILVGHAHHDHLGDVPSIAKRTGARIHGSKTTCLIAMAMGVPEAQCVPHDDVFGGLLSDNYAPLDGVEADAFDRKVKELLHPEAIRWLRPFERLDLTPTTGAPPPVAPIAPVP